MNKYLTYGALALGAYWLFGMRKGEAQARADQDNVLLPQILPVGPPARTADNPLTDDEKAALAKGEARLNKSGWLTYVGYDAKTSSGGITW